VVHRHYHDVDSVIVFLSGTFEVSQGDKKWTAGRGYTLVSGPGVVHGLRNAGKTRARMLTFHPSLEHKTIPEK
jgi:quercetin dioxygenase-like cupin family protein